MADDKPHFQPTFDDQQEQDPTVFKVHSVEELQQLIKHPDTPEDIWVKACNELSQATSASVTIDSERKTKPVRIATIACGLLLIAGVILSVPLFEQALNPTPIITAPLTAKQKAENEIYKFTERLKRDPASYGDLLNRGLVYVELEKYDLAIADFTSAMQIDPARPGALNNRAMAYQLAGQQQQALTDCNLLIKRFPKYSHGYAQRAQVYANIGQYPLAAKDMTKAIDLDPSRPGYYVGRESVYKKLGEKDHFKAAEVDPTYFHKNDKSR